MFPLVNGNMNYPKGSYFHYLHLSEFFHLVFVLDSISNTQSILSISILVLSKTDFASKFMIEADAQFLLTHPVD